MSYIVKSRFPTLFFQVPQLERISLILAREISNQFPNICIFSPYELIDFGAVYVDGKRCLKDIELQPQQNVKAHLIPKRFPETAALSKSGIVFEDEHLVAINKPGGVPIHATRDNLYENALEKMKKELGVKLYVTHRLDTETQGLSIFAKSADAQRKINLIFSSGQVEKFYRVGTRKSLALGNYNHFTSFETTIPRIFSLIQETPEWKSCHLKVLDCRMNGDFYVSSIQLMTGRTHQIRGQMALIGNPVIGDSIYNPQSFEKGQRMELTCERMAFQLGANNYDLKIETVSK